MALFDLVNKIDTTYFGEGVLKNYKEDRETLFLLLTFSTGWGLDDSLHTKLGIAKPRFHFCARAGIQIISWDFSNPTTKALLRP